MKIPIFNLVSWFVIVQFLWPGVALAMDYSETESLDMKAARNFDRNGFDFQIADGPIQLMPASLAGNYRCPELFRDAKFGIYMHWGLGSVVGFNGHYARYMYHQQEPAAARRDRETRRWTMSGYQVGQEAVYQHHTNAFGHPSRFGYKEFIPLWHADKFDSVSLASLYKECGARYISVMAVHCDNFDNYDSTYQSGNAYRMGPKRDIVAEWRKARAKEHLHFAIGSHLSNEYHEYLFYQGETDATGPLKGVPYDTMNPRNDGLYGHRMPDRLRRLNPELAQNWYRHSKELIDKYNPELLYLDRGLPNGDYGLNLAAHFYNHYLQVNGRPDGVMTIKRSSPSGFTLDIELLQNAGYRTGLIGKWHCGREREPKPGFDRWYSYWVNQYPHAVIQYVSDQGNLVVEEGQQSPLCTRRAVDFIREHAAKEGTGGKLFFLFVSYVDTHSPHNAAPVDLVEQYADATFRDIPAEQFAACHVLAKTPVSAKPEAERARRKEYYGAVSSLDREVGKVLAALASH